MRMKTSALTCALVLVAIAVGVASYQQRPAVASGTLGCSDPRGCPNLIVTEPILNSAHQTTQTFAPTDCAVAEGETKAGTRNLLVFPYKTPNLGPGALIIGNPNDHPDLFDFVTCHGHPHLKQYADYRLWTPAGYKAWKALRDQNPNMLAADVLAAHPELSKELVQGAKRGFCVVDYQPAPNFQGTRDKRNYLNCFSNQGIGVGWADEYVSRLDGQWIDVTDVTPGDYVLDVETNAEHVFVESNYRDNSTAIPLKVHR
jgi:lysyl oxidase